MDRIGPVLARIHGDLARAASDGEITREERDGLRAKLAGESAMVVDRAFAEADALAAKNRATRDDDRLRLKPADTRGARERAWLGQLTGRTARITLGEIARTVRETPRSEHFELARNLHTSGIARHVVDLPESPERRTIMAFLTANRQLVLLATMHRAPQAFFTATALDRLDRPSDLLTVAAGADLPAPTGSDAIDRQRVFISSLAARFWRDPRALATLRESHRGVPILPFLDHAPGHIDAREVASLRNREMRMLLRQTTGPFSVVLAAMAESTDFLDRFGRSAESVKDILRDFPNAIRHVRFGEYAEGDVIDMVRSAPAGWQYLPESMRGDRGFQERALRGVPALLTVPEFRHDLRPEVLADPELALRGAAYDGMSGPSASVALAAFELDTPERIASAPTWSTLALAPESLRRDLAFLRSYVEAGGSTGAVPNELWTPELARAAVTVRGDNLLSVPRRLWTVDVVAQALRYEHEQPSVNLLGDAIADWAPLSDRAVQERLLRANALILPWLDASLAQSPELAREVAARQPEALPHFAPDLRHDPAILSAASDMGAFLTQTVDMRRPELRPIIERLLLRSSDAFNFLPEVLQRDPELRRLGASGAFQPTEGVSRPLELSPAEALEMARANVGYVRRFPLDLLRDVDLMADAVREFPPLLDALPTLAVPRNVLLARHPELEGLAAGYSERLARHGISDPFRFQNRHTLDKILAVRDGERGNTGRPKLLAIFARSDHNGALRANLLPELTRHFDVHYFEATTDQDLIDFWRRTAQGGPIAQVVIAGHGNREAIALAAGDPRLSPGGLRENILDFSDAERLRGALRDLPYAEGAELFLWSCSVGRGRDEVANIAGMLARATGLKTHAYVIPSSGRGYFGARPHFRAENPFTYYAAQPSR